MSVQLDRESKIQQQQIDDNADSVETAEQQMQCYSSRSYSQVILHQL
jgi:hypothetical protein